MSLQSLSHRIFIDTLSDNDRHLLWIECERSLQAELLGNKNRHTSYERRIEANLLSIAMVFSAIWDRRSIRELSKSVCHNANLRRLRCGLGRWEPFHIDGPGAAIFNQKHLSGSVIAAFHFCDYRMLPIYLASMGLKIDLLSDAENSSRVRSILTSERVSKHLSKGKGFLQGISVRELEDIMTYLDSSDHRTPWQLLDNLRQGHSLVIFPDGNSGTSQGEGYQGNSVIANLMGRKIRIKSGPAMLAYAAGSFVVPVFPYAEKERTCLRVYAPIYINKGETIHEYRDRVSATLISQLEAEILSRPEEWEEWHNFFWWVLQPPFNQTEVTSCSFSKLPEFAKETRIILTDDWLWRLKIGETQHVIDVRTCQSFGTNMELGRLVDMAERGTSFGAWFSGVQEPFAAYTAFSFLLANEKIRVQH